MTFLDSRTSGGPPAGKTLSWVNLPVPDGTDYLELMLSSQSPATQAERGTKNHICLMTPDIQTAVTILESRRAKTGYSKPIEIKVDRRANGRPTSMIRISLVWN